MKKLLSIMLISLMLIALLTACGAPNNTDTDSQGDETNTDTESNINTDETNTDTADKNEDKEANDINVEINTIETRKYYREFGSNYTKFLNCAGYKEDQIFREDVFEMKKESQYIAFKSKAELEVFTLLNHNEIEEDFFESNYVVALLHYFRGPSVGGEYSVGFYDADFIQNETIEVDRVWKYNEDATEDVVDIYMLHFIAVPKNEIQTTGEVFSISVNENVVEQYNREAICIDTTVEKTTAYYFNERADIYEIDAFKNLSNLPSFPCIAIHLDKAIETDYIVNGFKYENGEVFITVQVFETTQMEYLHGISANLLVVSLVPHVGGLEINVPDDNLANCKINVIFENVVAIN